ncbi:hypothetical protein LJC11_03040 [Bacteroidales bacterium OttesenSCG-928-I21]|nr:hypothetical protein [Bacteroidales bacterium OttesenSCG-928-I21]
MIKIIHKESGESFDLKEKFKISIRRTNPFLSDEGSASLSVELPRSPKNDKLLNWPGRIDRAKYLNTRVKVIVICNSFQETGILQITGFGDMIQAVILIAESEIYSVMKNTQMTDVFTKVRDDFSGTVVEKRQAWIRYLESILTGTDAADDDLYIFRVGIKAGVIREMYSNGREIIVSLNEYEPYSGVHAFFSKRGEFNVEMDGEKITYPSGSLITPFLKVKYVLKTIFSYLGYSFDTDQLPPSFDRIVLLNNTGDAIMEGVLKYWQLVPTCTVFEYISSFMKRFGCVFSFSGTQRKVTVTFLKDFDTLIRNAIDLSAYKSNPFSIEFEEKKSIALSCGHTYEYYNSSFSNFEDFKKSYPNYYTYTGRPVFKVESQTTTTYRPYPNGIVYFERIKAFYNVTWKETYLANKYLYYAECTLIFSFCGEDVVSQSGYDKLDINVGDQVASNIIYFPPFSDIYADPDSYYYCMGVNNIRLLNGSINYSTLNEDREAIDETIPDCPIMHCFYLGILGNFSLLTIVGSPNSDINSDGNKIVDFSLSFSSEDGIYNTFYKDFDDRIKKSYIPINCPLNIPEHILSDFNMCLPIMIDGQPIWPEILDFELSDPGAEVIEFTGRTLKKYED